MVFKSKDEQKTSVVSLTLDAETVELFVKEGDGNKSLGARNVARQFLEMKAGVVPRRRMTSRAAAEQGHAGTKATEPSAGVAAARAKLLKTRALIEKLELEKVKGRWKKGGYWMSITAERKMLEDHPELADYAPRE